MKLWKRFFVRQAVFLLTFLFLGRGIARPQDLSDRTTCLELGKGVVADAVKKDSESEKAGLQAGDILLSWSRGAAKGDIESPFDLAEIEVEQAPRGAVTIEGLRATLHASGPSLGDQHGGPVRRHQCGYDGRQR